MYMHIHLSPYLKAAFNFYQNIIYHVMYCNDTQIILDDKLDDDQLLSTRHTFRCSLRERELGIGSLPQLADEGITQILQDMNWFDNRVKFYLAKYAYGDTHISVGMYERR